MVGGQISCDERRPCLLILNPIAKRQRISDGDNLRCLRPGPSITKTGVIRMVSGSKISASYDESIIGLMEVANVWMSDPEVAGTSLHDLLQLHGQQTRSQSQYTFR